MDEKELKRRLFEFEKRRKVNPNLTFARMSKELGLSWEEYLAARARFGLPDPRSNAGPRRSKALQAETLVRQSASAKLPHGNKPVCIIIGQSDDLRDILGRLGQ